MVRSMRASRLNLPFAIRTCSRPESVRLKTFLGSGNHRDFLESALGAAAEHEHALGIFGIGDFPDFHLLVFGAVGEPFEAAGGKFFGILLTAAAGDVDQIGIAQLAD